MSEDHLEPLPDIKFYTPLTPSALSGRKGELAWIRLDKLFIDKSYQRDVGGSGKGNVRKIIEGFSWHLFSPLIVAPRENGTFAVIGGQHRAIAARMHGAIAELPCLILHCGRAEEARAFAVINGQVTKVSAQQVFKAKLAAGDASAVAANRAAQNAGVRILLTTASAQAVKFNETQARGTIETCCNLFGEKTLTAALTLIVRAGDGGRGILRAALIAACCDVFMRNPAWLVRVDDCVAAVSRHGLRKILEECEAQKRGSGMKTAVRAALAKRVANILHAAFDPAAKAVPAPQPAITAKAAEPPPQNMAPVTPPPAVPEKPGVKSRFYSEADKKRAMLGR